MLFLYIYKQETLQHHTLKPTLHGIFHILCKHVPHDLSADLAHIQFLGKPKTGRLRLKSSSGNGTLLFNKIAQTHFM